MIKNMPFRHIIIPTFVTPAINSLPKLNPLDSMINWLANAVIRIALSRITVMIDRALAEDLAAAFEVRVEDMPTDISGVIDFIYDYVSHHSELESIGLLTYRLQVISGRLVDLAEKMTSSFDG